MSLFSYFPPTKHTPKPPISPLSLLYLLELGQSIVANGPEQAGEMLAQKGLLFFFIKNSYKIPIN